jgi:hypothetical protein
MAISKVVVVDGNNLIVRVDRGVAGRGVTDVEPVVIDGSLYLIFTFSDGTTDTVGPISTIQYVGTSPIVVNGSTISLTTVPVNLGGTGQVTANAGFNALAPTQTGNTGKYLKTDGTNSAWDLLDISTADITGTLPIVNGGTGQTTANASFNALAPSQTTNTGKYLKTDGTNTSWDLLDISTADITGVLPLANGGTASSTASGARTNLGLGTIATQDASSVAITGGSITGITDLAVADGGTGASNAADARTNLGLGTISTQNASSVSITGGTITGITDLAVADGGTGSSTAAGAMVNLLPSYTGNANKRLGLDGTATGLEWVTDGGGTVTSVDVSGGTTGLSFSGGPVTTSGTITLSGTLDLDNGGTGATTAAGARTNLNAADQALTLTAGTGLSGGGDLTANRSFSITNTGVTAAAYGAASKTLTATVNAQGQLTVLADTPIAITNTQISGLGTMSTQNANAVAITGGTITGITDLAVADGGTGASDAAGARTNLNAANQATTITAGTGLSGGGDLSANRTIDIANTTVTAGAFGSASNTLTATVNAQGQLTALAATPIAIANTQISGLGTMSTQNSNAVTITGGSITGITDLAIADGGTGASNAPDARSNLGLGSAAVLNAGVALGVATLDAGGTVPLSQIPASIQGGVSYQGAWNASTNTPTLVSSVGSKGYYYVVSVAGNTNLNGVTDWLVGDWAIYNGTAWEKIDNTDQVASVNGYTGVVVLSNTDVGAPPTSLTISAGTGLSGGGSLAANRTLSIANTTVTAAPYGTASAVPTFTVNGQGQLTAASDVTIAIANTQVSGLGTMSTQNANSVAITGGSITGITDLAIADGGTGASTAPDARTNLGLGTIATQDASSVAITGGSINGTTIGATTPSTVTGTTVTATTLVVNDNATLGSSNTDTVTFNGRVNSDLEPATDNAYDLGRTGHEWRNLYLTGTGNIDNLIADTADINGGTIDATAIGSTTPSSGAFTTVTASTAIGVASGGTGVTTSTGTGSVVLSTSPTLVTPLLGTPTSATLTNATGLPLTTGVTGTLSIANGGTGQTTAATAITALSGTQTSGYYLRSDGTNTALAAIVAGDVPTLNQNTTGTAANITASSNATLTTLSSLSLAGSQVTGNISGNAANVTGTVAIANGGTGQTTANAAFNALVPSQTGNNGKYLTTDGTDTSWAANPLGTVTSVGGTGTVSGISLSGTVTTSGNLTLGGTLNLSSPPAIGNTTPSTGNFTTLTENGVAVVTQSDIGSAPNEIPLNQYLGSLAYQNGDAYFNTGMTVGFRNRIINGAMTISQRGASPTITGGGDYSVDRYINYYSGNVFTSVQSTTAPAGFINSLLLTNTTASASPTYSFFGQKIEGLNCFDLGFGTSNASIVTLSFWVRSSVIGIYSFSLSNSDGNRSYAAQYTINTANTWELKTVSIGGDTTGTWLTTNGTGIFIRWNMGTGQSGRLISAGSWQTANADGATGSTGANTWANTVDATFYITGVQLEKGNIATSFDVRPYGTEFQLCQRYYQQIGGGAGEIPFLGNATGVNQGYAAYQFPVQMRTAPTFALTGSWSWTNQTFTSSFFWTSSGSLFPTPRNIFISGVVSNTLVVGNSLIGQTAGATTDLIKFSAEL